MSTKLKNAIAAAASSPLAPSPAPEPQMPNFAVDPEAIKERAMVMGTFEPEKAAKRNLQDEARAGLAWVGIWNPAAADAIKREQFAIEERALQNAKRLATLNDAGRNLESEIVERAKLRQEQVDVRAQLDQARALLSSPDALDLEDAVLLRTKLLVEHLPATIKELDHKITASTAKVESLAKASGCDREKFLAQMLAQGAIDYRTNNTVIRLHGAGHLTL